MCFTTGLGHRWPRHALHVDSRISGQEVPPGYTVDGPMDFKAQKESPALWADKLVAPYLYPAWKRWPGMEAYWGVFPAPADVRIHRARPDVAGNAYVWGYPAARP